MTDIWFLNHNELTGCVKTLHVMLHIKRGNFSDVELLNID